MEQRLPLYQDGVPAGLLLRREEGLHVVFTADCADGEGVRKLWLRSQNGPELLLGTLTPENGHWRLTRRLARSGLERQGLTGEVWGVLVPGGQAPSPTSSEQPSERPPITPADPVLANALAAAPCGRWQKRGTVWQLTLPWQVGRPFPLLPLFCFARPGQGELLFFLGEQGYPASVQE